MAMITFKYIARNPSTGKKVSAEIQADTEASAAKILTEQGLAPLSIKLKNGSSDSPLAFLTNRVPTKERILFSRQLSTLINAGLPLVQSLRTVLGQTKNKTLQGVIANVIGDVESGSSLSSSLIKHPRVFNKVFTSLVEAGEASGTLDDALDRLAIQQEKDAEVVSKVRGAMVYPIIVLIVMTGVVGFMLVSVIPQVKTLFDGLPGAKLPFLTVVLLALSKFITKLWWVFILLIIGSVAGVSYWFRSPSGKSFQDRLKMRAPAIGPLFMKMYMARFARTGTTLVASGVPLIQMLQITGDAVDNSHISDALKGAIEKVKGGKPLSEALEGDPNFLELVPNMLRIGEQSGQIESMLAKTAEYYEKEVEEQIKTISTIIEPALMVVLGVVAITIVSAVLLPIYSLVGQNVIK